MILFSSTHVVEKIGMYVTLFRKYFGAVGTTTEVPKVVRTYICDTFLTL